MLRRLATRIATPRSRAGDVLSRLASRSQSNLYFALVFLPAERRDAFRDVYRFLRAADDVADGGLPGPVARARLAEFARTLDDALAGRPAPEAACRVARAVRRFGLDREHFDTILSALADDVAPRRFASLEDLERWSDAVSGTLGLLSIRVLGVDTPAARAYAHDVGVALQLANVLRDVAEDARQGRLYLPVDRLVAAGGQPQDVLAGRFSPAFAVVAQALGGRIRSLVAGARARLSPAERRALLVPEIWADVYLALVDELDRSGWDVFTRPPYLHRRLKLALALLRWARDRNFPAAS